MIQTEPDRPLLFRGLGNQLELVRACRRGIRPLLSLLVSQTTPSWGSLPPPSSTHTTMRNEARTPPTPTPTSISAPTPSPDARAREWKFRSFVAEDRVALLSLPAFVTTSSNGDFVYLETSSSDPFYSRGEWQTLVRHSRVFSIGTSHHTLSKSALT